MEFDVEKLCFIVKKVDVRNDNITLTSGGMI